MPKFTPLFWHGNKAAQVKRLRLALPESFDYLIEPFAGSAAFSLAMIRERFIGGDCVWINDKNCASIAFYETVRDDCHKLVEQLSKEFDEYSVGDRKLFLYALGKVNNPTGDVVELAKSFYIVSRLSIAGKAAKAQNFCDPFKSTHGLRPSEYKLLPDFGALLQGTKITNLDFRDIEPLSSEPLIYLDAPYGDLKKDENSYGKGLVLERGGFSAYCESLKTKCHLLLSYGDNPESLELFSGWNICRIPVVRKSAKKKTQTELVITNYEIPYSAMLDYEWEVAA